MFRENEQYQQVPTFSSAESTPSQPRQRLEEPWPGLHFNGRKRVTDTELIRTIARHSSLVLVISVLAVVGAGAVTFSMTPTYEATAVLSVPQLSSAVLPLPLVKSTEVEAQVVNALRASLPPEEHAPKRISDQIEIDTDQNIVHITAHSDTAKKAAMTANAWADCVAKDIAEALRTEEQQLEAAEGDVEAANEALRAFEEEYGFGVLGFGTAEEELQADRERVKGYKVQQDHIKQIITQASTLGASTTPGSVSSSTRTIYLVLDDLLQKASTESEDDAFHIQILRRERRTDEQLLETYETAMQSVEEALARAKALRETIQQGGNIGSPQLVAGLTVDLLQSGSLGYSTEPSFQAPSLPIRDLSPDQQIALLDTTISILESRKKLISAGMTQLSVKALDALYTMILVLERREAALGTTIEQLSADISRREQEMANRRPDLDSLVEARDKAEQTYESLRSQMEQAGLFREAKVIASAAEPSKPIRPNWIDWVQNLSIAGVLGLVVGGIAALAVERSGLTLGEAAETEGMEHREEWESF